LALQEEFIQKGMFVFAKIPSYHYEVINWAFLIEEHRHVIQVSQHEKWIVLAEHDAFRPKLRYELRRT
jgi:hypothetical protein